MDPALEPESATETVMASAAAMVRESGREMELELAADLIKSVDWEELPRRPVLEWNRIIPTKHAARIFKAPWYLTRSLKKTARFSHPKLSMGWVMDLTTKQ